MKLNIKKRVVKLNSYLNHKEKEICFIGVTLLLITSCSSLTSVIGGLEAATDVLTPSKGLSVDAQIGDRQNALGDVLEVDADNIQEITTGEKLEAKRDIIQTNNQAPFWLIFSLISTVAVGVVGWILPTPKFITKHYNITSKES